MTRSQLIHLLMQIKPAEGEEDIEIVFVGDGEGFFYQESGIKATGRFINGEAWVKYDPSTPTLMEMLGVTDEGESGDCYILHPPDSFRGYYGQDYLQYLGLADGGEGNE